MKRILCLRLEGPAQPADALQSVAARCKQFTPLVGIDPDVFPQSVLLDITQVVHLFGSEATLVERIAAELRAGGWQLRTAVAHTPGAAWALAGYGGRGEGGRGKAEGGGRKGETAKGETRGRGDAETEGHGDFFFSASPCLRVPASSPPSPLPPSAFHLLPLEALRLPELLVALLHSLGVWRIEQLQALPRRELSSRFGPELLDCLDRVTGRLAEPLPAWEPPAQFAVTWSAEFPATRRETILSALELLVRRLAAMLTQAGRGAMRLECLLQCAAGGPLQVAVGLFRPVAWANHLVELLEVQFESLQLPGPVDSIRLAATSTAPLELRQQEMFFEGPQRVHPHHLPGLIDRLSNRLGHTRVMRVRLIPDAQPELACHYLPLVLGRKKNRFDETVPAVKKRPAADRSMRRPPLVSRPLRMLTQPVRLPAGIEGPFSVGSRQERIVRRVGPERIETGWWRGRTVARDYYRVETTTGRCYWIFRQLPGGPWFLHGMFD